MRGILGPLLEQHPDKVSIVNRSLDRVRALKLDFPEIDIIHWESASERYDLLIHALALQGHGTVSGENFLEKILPSIAFHKDLWCYDLTYQLEQDTPFITLAKTFGTNGTDGLGMLLEQAAHAFYLWHGVLPKTDALRAELGRL